MNPHPAPKVPGKTEWERFDNAVRKALSVPRHNSPSNPSFSWPDSNARNRRGIMVCVRGQNGRAWVGVLSPEVIIAWVVKQVSYCPYRGASWLGAGAG